MPIDGAPTMAAMRNSVHMDSSAASRYIAETLCGLR